MTTPEKTTILIQGPAPKISKEALNKFAEECNKNYDSRFRDIYISPEALEDVRNWIYGNNDPSYISPDRQMVLSEKSIPSTKCSG